MPAHTPEHEAFAAAPHDALSAARALLEWYADAGANDMTGDVPVNRTERRTEPVQESPREERPKPGYEERTESSYAPPAPSPAKRAAAAPKAQQAQTEEELAAIKARELADAAQNLAELEQAVRGFDLLSVCKTANKTVFCDGVAGSKLMIVGEAPGADEDAQGIPFCGASGQLLEQALNSVGLKRSENYYISNAIFWRPPANRKPSDEELEACRPFVEKHIALIKPRVLALAGGTAVTAILGDKTGVTKLRGTFREYTNPYLNGETIPALALFHPSYLLRSPGQKRHMWRDLLTLEAKLKEFE